MRNIERQSINLAVELPNGTLIHVRLKSCYC